MNIFTGLKGEGMLIGGCPSCGRQDCVAMSCERNNAQAKSITFPAQGTAGQVKQESDPSGKNPHEPGAKLDAGKSPLFRGLLEYFPRACCAVADISAFGASKYAWNGWESVPDGINRYSDAELRHFTKEAIEGAYDYDSGYLHKAHKAWNALAALELHLRQEELNTGDAEVEFE